MIDELLSYFSKDSYTKKDEEIQKAFDLYEEGLSLDGPEGEARKEEARHSIESQLVASGQAEQDSVFFNPDEFFPGGRRDSERIDAFRKDMLLNRSSQQMLWSFAGTTGAMTVLTEKHLESLGRNLEDLKPAGMRRNRIKKNSAAETGSSRIYLYGDGSVSETYNKEKARLRFDRTSDKGGFDWNREKYDPNYRVEKQGWFGALNKEGDWVMVDETSGRQGGITAEPEGQTREIRMVSTLDGPVIFDTALLLVQEEEEYYYTLEGELYGAVKNDPDAAWKRVEAELKGTSPVGVVLPQGTPDEVKKVYREKLGKGVKILEEGSTETRDLVQADRSEREEAAAASLTLGAFARLKESGLTNKQAGEILSAGEEVIELPLNPFIKEDRDAIASDLTPEAEAWLDRKGEEVSGEELGHVMPFISAVLPLLQDTTLDDTAVLDEAWNSGLGKTGKQSDAVLTGKVSLGELCQGKKPFGQAGSPKEFDFFQSADLEKASAASKLTEGEAASLKETVGKLNIPPVDRKGFNKKLSSALAEYRTVQMSTGMTVGDLVRSVDAINRKSPDAGNIASKEVYFEESLGIVLDSAALMAAPVKSVPRESLYKPLDVSTGLVLEKGGSVRGTSEETLPAVLPETVLPLTGDLLAVLSVPSEGAGPLSRAQLEEVRAVYRKAGLSETVSAEAVKQWESQAFTGDEFDLLKNRLESKLGTSGISSIEKQQSMIASGKVSGVSQIKAGTNMVIPPITTFVPEQSEVIQAVADTFYEEGGVTPELILPREELIPLIASAASGQWEGVPSAMRSPIKQAMTRTVGSQGVSAPSLLSGMTPQKAAPISRIPRVSKRIPMATASFGGQGYRNLGYRINPSRNHVQALKSQAIGSRVENLVFPEASVSSGPTSSIPSGTNPIEKTAIAVKGSSVSATDFTPPSRLTLRQPNTPGLSGQGNIIPFRNGKPAAVKAVRQNQAGSVWNPDTLSHPGGMSRGAASGATPFMGQPAGGQGFVPPQFGRQEMPGQMDRMDRINANYEADKMALGQGEYGEQRMLAKTQSHSVGHAGGEIRKTNRTVFIDDVIEDLQREF